MPDKFIFEYSVIRLVPRVEREEFINIGIILFCKSKKLIKVKYYIDRSKAFAINKEIDLEEVSKYLQSLEKIANGEIDGGPIARLEIPYRYRWLTAKRSTIIQMSNTHCGLSEDLDLELEKLYNEYVA